MTKRGAGRSGLIAKQPEQVHLSEGRSVQNAPGLESGSPELKPWLCGLGQLVEHVSLLLSFCFPDTPLSHFVLIPRLFASSSPLLLILGFPRALWLRPSSVIILYPLPKQADLLLSLQLPSASKLKSNSRASDSCIQFPQHLYLPITQLSALNFLPPHQPTVPQGLFPQRPSLPAPHSPDKPNPAVHHLVLRILPLKYIPLIHSFTEHLHMPSRVSLSFLPLPYSRPPSLILSPPSPGLPRSMLGPPLGQSQLCSHFRL